MTPQQVHANAAVSWHLMAADMSEIDAILVTDRAALIVII